MEMAAWQYTVKLIPRAKLMNLFGSIPQAISEEIYEATQWWSDQQPSDDYAAFLASFVTPHSSWSEDVKCRGEEDGNRIHAVLEDDRVVEMSVRFDLRNSDNGFLRNVVDFAQRNDCVFLGDNMELIAPHLHDLEVKLINSDAARFVADPACYLEEIAKTHRALRRA